MAKQLIDLLCKRQSPLQGCCCEDVIYRLWREQLPTAVKAAVADMNLGEGNLETTLGKANAVYHALQPDQTPQVAKATTTEKSEEAPENGFYLHKKFGKRANYCRRMSSCPWRVYVSPPQENIDKWSDK